MSQADVLPKEASTPLSLCLHGPLLSHPGCSCPPEAVIYSSAWSFLLRDTSPRWALTLHLPLENPGGKGTHGSPLAEQN